MQTTETKKQTIFQNPIILTLIALLCCALWGSATPAIKTGYRLLAVEGVSSIMLFAAFSPIPGKALSGGRIPSSVFKKSVA